MAVYYKGLVKKFILLAILISQTHFINSNKKFEEQF